MTQTLHDCIERYRPALENKIILLIDDEPAVRDCTRSFLDYVGCVTAERCNGKEALDYMLSPEGEKVDAIITDNSMPVLDGIVFLSRMVREKYGGIDSFVEKPLFTILNSASPISDNLFMLLFGRTKSDIPNIVTIQKPYSAAALYSTLSEGLSRARK